MHMADTFFTCSHIFKLASIEIKTVLDKKITEDILDKKINSLQDGLRKSYSDAVKDVVGKKVETVNNEVMSMNDGIKALKEEESNNLGFNDSKKEDDERIMRILSAITDEKFDMSNVVKHYRSGKRSDNVRPLLVRLKSKGIGIGHDMKKN
ncbi:hypothetical protein HELRODRAFT_183573 [Helobdella robusta]|uniref:Uncharacterized protein n=1 Tax=Helobdella robusta TaxID=6412 RepID=T1FJV1_HELRO|nr:hypothetical protein HELRODRAFT_183573 [Helobdella robusta]ESO10477.1 hypothetical protein HELRODRAFT_183573 [Helobdella robusta]